jgi:hypothetical protein
VAAFDESGDAADGEEITNKIPRIQGGLRRPGANQRTHEMCPIHADFKQFRASKAKEFRECRKLSSIM